MNKNKLLLIDDDIELVELNSDYLKNQGFDVHIAYSGKEGLEKAKTLVPDVIVLDVMMNTNSEGFDIARSLKKNDTTANIPVIMLTSVNQTVPFEYEADPEFLPVSKFVNKPVTPKELLVFIKEMLTK